MEAFFTVDVLLSFITLSLLEIVLGIDNLIFIALVVQNLQPRYRKKARMIGLTLALVMRIVMLLGIAWIMSLTEPVLTLAALTFSWRDLLLLLGGMFLIFKSTVEMHADLAGREHKKHIVARTGFFACIVQIVLIDLVFSFDSVITAVGMTSNIPVIVAAMVVAMIVMLAASGYIAHFLEHYPTFKMLALAFILMIGTLLVAEGMGFHVPRGYVYFAFAFSILVESLNTARLRNEEKRGRKK